MNNVIENTSCLQTVNFNFIDYEKDIIGIDIGQRNLFTFSNKIKLYGKMINTYDINDIGIKLVTWCKENPQFTTKGINEWMKKIDRIRIERKYYIRSILNQILDENPNIKVLVMEHDLLISRELINDGIHTFKIGLKTKNEEITRKGWRKYTKGLTCMIDDTQEIIKDICDQRDILLIQTPRGWVSTYRCSKDNKIFDKKTWLMQYNTSEKERCKHDYYFNRSVHKINNTIQKIINENIRKPNYELAKLIGNQEIRLHNSKFRC